MAASERATFEVYLDASKARAELDRVSQSASTFGGSLDKLDRGAGKAKQAIGSLSPVLGDTARAAAQAVDTLGDLAGVVSGSSGMLVAGFGAAAVGVAAYVTWLDRTYKEGQRAKRQIEDLSRVLNTQANEALRTAAARVRDFAQELEALGKSSMQQRRDSAFIGQQQLAAQELNAQRAILAIEEKRKPLLEAISKVNAANATTEDIAAGSAAKQALPTFDALLVSAQARLDSARAMLPVAQEEFKITDALLRRDNDRLAIQRTANQLADARADRAKPKAAGASVDEGTLRFQDAVNVATVARAADLAAQDAALTEGTSRFQASVDAEMTMREASLLHGQMINAAHLEGKIELAAQEIAVAKQVADAEIAFRDAAVNAAIAITVAGAERLIDGIVEGNETALAEAALFVSKQAGTFLVGEGIKSIAAAIGYAWNPATAGLAPAGLATGAALVGTGLAMGGVASIGMSALSKHTGGAGPPERGVNQPRSGGGGDAPAQVTFVSNYGVYGPAPEDAAREQAAMVRTQRRRGIR